MLRVGPLSGETTWSFAERVAGSYGLEVMDLAGHWRWVNPVSRERAGRLDGEVLLDANAQAQLAGWCGIPEGHLAAALPSWGPGAQAFDSLAGGPGEQGRARWRAGVRDGGPVVFACRLCAARRGAVGGRVRLFRRPWQRLCGRHGRWLLGVGEGHPWQNLDVGSLGGELERAQRRWGRVAAVTRGAGWSAGEVFALASAVVCGWWEQDGSGAGQVPGRGVEVWQARCAEVVAGARRGGEPPGWGGAAVAAPCA